MECIICQDDNSEPLQDNTLCDCKYKVHPSCWIDYVHSKNTVTCLLCRKERVESKKDIPSASSLPTIIEEQEQEQQSQNAVEPEGNLWQPEGSFPQTEGSLWQIPVVTNKEMTIKIIKIGMCIVIVIFVFVLIWA